MASCGSHSAGIRHVNSATSVQPPLQDRRVGVDAAIAQERPAAANFFHAVRIALRHQNLFARSRRFGDDLPKRIGDKRRAPEFQTMIGRPFEADAIHRRDVNAVRDRVRPLNGAPGVQLRRAVLRFFGRMPADGGWIEKNVRARDSSKGARPPDTTDPSRPARRDVRSACRSSGSRDRRA